MLNALLGFLAAVVLYTFFPSLAEIPSRWMRNAVSWVRGKFQR